MATKNSVCITENSISVVLDFTPYTVRADHPRFGSLQSAAKAALTAEKNGEPTEGLWDDFINVFHGTEPPAAADLQKATKVIEGLEYKDGRVYYNGTELQNAVVPVIRRYINEGIDPSSLMNFLNRLMNNPSYRSVEQLWNFIEKNGLSVDNDGYILFYKVVRSDYKDKHSGTFDNTPGQVIECPRNKVNDDPNIACSYGFHVGGWGYSGPTGIFYNTGDKIVICKVDPADVVSVPNDSACGKCRCCKYEVVADYKGKLPQGLATADGDDDRANSQQNFSPEGWDGPRDAVDDELLDYEDEDEFEYADDDEEEEYEDLDPADLEVGDVITFSYPNDEGISEFRKVEVVSVSNVTEVINGRLLKGDASYTIAQTVLPKYRNFKWDKMSNIQEV